MATISNTPRPGYVWDSTDNVWYPIGVGGHAHPDYITQATAVNPTLIDAKGDIITATAADTPARLAVGNNGETLVADSSTSTGLRYQAPVAVNPIINGGFDVWQRGTSVAYGSNGVGYSADRWYVRNTGSSTVTSRQATGDTTNLPNIQYCARYSRDSGSTNTAPIYFTHNIETTNSIPYAGKTVTYSFYARKGANLSGTIAAQLWYGTGTDQNLISGYTGATAVVNTAIQSTLTTTWQRFTYTAAMPATATEIACHFDWTPSGTAGAADYIEVTGVQLEVGSVATPFRRSGGTIQGELAACQRYYYRIAPNGTFRVFTSGQAVNANDGFLPIPFPVQMRIRPTALEQSGTAGHYSLLSAAGVRGACSSVPTYDGSTTQWVGIITAFATGHLVAGNCTTFGAENASAYLGWSAEL